MHTFWAIVQWLLIIGILVAVGVGFVWGTGKGESNVGRIFGDNAKSHWYSKDYDKRDF